MSAGSVADGQPGDRLAGPGREEIRQAVSRAIEQAWWSRSKPSSEVVMEVFSPYLDRLERAQAKLAAVEERAGKWAALASIDNWAETTGDAEETALADAGRAILAITGGEGAHRG